VANVSALSYGILAGGGWFVPLYVTDGLVDKPTIG